MQGADLAALGPVNVTCRRLAAQRGHSRVAHFIDSVLGGKLPHVTGELVLVEDKDDDWEEEEVV